jgi:hypothetical protein
VLSGVHALGTTVVRGATTPDTVKAALYLVNQSIGVGTTAYSATGEVSGAGYTAGGVTVTNATAPSVSGTTGIWTPSANIAYSSVTLSSAFDTVLLYNSTQSNASIASYTFGSQTVIAGTLTLTMPGNTSSTALIQLA